MNPITRRAFLAAGTAALANTALGARRPSSKRPNVLFILTDQQARWTLGVYGGKLPGTPNIDSIGTEGAIFRNFFVTSAVCTPSRGCYMTGRYPHFHGAYHNELPMNADEFTLGHMFQRAGYETGYAGKWHLDGKNDPNLPDWIPDARSFGFEDHRWMFNAGHWKRIVEKPEGWPGNISKVSAEGMRVRPNPSSVSKGQPDMSYSVTEPGEFFTDWLTDKAVEFIRRPRTSPFFYVLSYPDPHQPYTVEPKYDSMFSKESLYLPETFHQKDLPIWAEKQREEESLKPEHVSGVDDPRREEIFRQRKSQYLGEVKCIDDNVGRILKTLRDRNQLDDTLIIFASDHGDLMGEHGMYFKNLLYEPAHHVGMLMRWPGGIRPGTEINECVANVDLLPTLAGLLSIETAGREQGHDASPLIRQKKSDWKNEAFIHKDNDSQSGVFTQQWELGLEESGDNVLFDRMRDDLQINNLYHDPQYKTVVDDLTSRTVQHNEKLDTPALKWLRPYSSIPHGQPAIPIKGSPQLGENLE